MSARPGDAGELRPRALQQNGLRRVALAHGRLLLSALSLRVCAVAAAKEGAIKNC
jgi:hypothetical protein